MPHRPPAGGSGRLPHPCGPPSKSLQRSAHHDLDVTVVARVVLGGDVAEPGIVPSRTDGPLPHRMRLPTSSPLPERSRLCASRTASARRAWKYAQLAAQPQVVADRPVLDGLPVLEADNVDLAVGDRLVGGGEPHELAGVASVE